MDKREFNCNIFETGHFSRFDLVFEIQKYMDFYEIVERSDRIGKKSTYRILHDYFKKIDGRHFIINSRNVEIDCIPLDLVNDQRTYEKLKIAMNLRKAQYGGNFNA